MALGFFEKVDVSTKRGSSDEYDRGQRRGHASGRPAPSRSAPASRRWRTSSPRRRSRRTTCSAAARRWRCRRSSRRCGSCSRCASSSPTSSTPTGPSPSTSTTSRAHFDVVQPRRDRRRPHLGLPALRRRRALFLTYKLEDVSVSTSGQRAAALGRDLAAPIAGHVRSPTCSAPGITSSVRALARPGTRATTACSRPSGMLPQRSRPSSPTRSLGSENIFARYGGFARFYHPLCGPFVFSSTLEAGLHHQPRPAGRARSSSATSSAASYDVRGFRLRSLGPRILRAQLARSRTRTLVAVQRRRQHAAHLQRRDRVPASSRRSASRAWSSSTPGNAFNPRIATAAGSSARRRRSSSTRSGPVRRSSAGRRAPHQRSASASAGSRRSARCASSGASRSSACPGEDSIVFEFTIGNFF